MITIHFDFKHFREKTDLEQLNKVLDALPLQDLRLEDEESYLCTTTDNTGKLLHYRHGLDKGTLHCTLARKSPGYYYRIDTFTESPTKSHQEQIQKWIDSHMDRTICCSIVTSFKKQDGYTIIHRSAQASNEQSQMEMVPSCLMQLPE